MPEVDAALVAVENENAQLFAQYKERRDEEGGDEQAGFQRFFDVRF